MAPLKKLGVAIYVKYEIFVITSLISCVVLYWKQLTPKLTYGSLYRYGGLCN